MSRGWTVSSFLCIFFGHYGIAISSDTTSKLYTKLIHNIIICIERSYTLLKQQKMARNGMKWSLTKNKRSPHSANFILGWSSHFYSTKTKSSFIVFAYTWMGATIFGNVKLCQLKRGDGCRSSFSINYIIMGISEL